jgi:hypothetical protein
MSRVTCAYVGNDDEVVVVDYESDGAALEAAPNSGFEVDESCENLR